MSYSIEISARVAGHLRRVPRALRQSLVEHVDRLGSNPRLGTRIWDGPLSGRMLYPFVVDHGPRTFRLAVMYVFSDDEQRIVITAIGMLIGDGDELDFATDWPPM